MCRHRDLCSGLDVGLIKNSTAWIAVSESKCHELQAKYHFTREDMVFSDVLETRQELPNAEIPEQLLPELAQCL